MRRGRGVVARISSISGLPDRWGLGFGWDFERASRDGVWEEGGGGGCVVGAGGIGGRALSTERRTL